MSSRFARPDLNGTVIVRRFQPPQLETEARIRKGDLKEPLEAVAGRVGLRARCSTGSLSAGLCLVDDQEIVLMGKLVDKGVYYITGGVCTDAEGSDTSLQSSKAAAVNNAAWGAAPQPPDITVGWCFDARMLLHRSDTNRSPETPHRLQRAIETLQGCDRALDVLPTELLAPFTVHTDSSLEHSGRAVPSISAANRSKWIPTRLATFEEVCSFQDPKVYEHFLTTGAALVNLKSDVYCNDETSSVAARLSAGAAIDASVAALRGVAASRSGTASSAAGRVHPLVSFCLVRPPGHHCAASQPSGFCLVNNVAIAAQQLRVRYASVLPTGPPRIAILDLDVHFGEETASFVEGACDPASLLYLSLHRYDHGQFYPFDGRGDTAYVGGSLHPSSKGSICNVAVHTNGQHPARCEQVISDHLMNSVIEEIFLPRLAQFEPDLIMVSLGFDAAYGDPLGKMAVEGGFASVLSRLKGWCLHEGRTAGLVVVLEGGYNPEAVAQGVLSVALALSLPRTDPLLQRFLEEKPPKVWADLRQRQERRHREWQHLQREREEGDAAAASSGCRSEFKVVASEEPEQVQEDALLLDRHKRWCAELVAKVQKIHQEAMTLRH
ncbi:histone deacetylase, putative [Leishmania tarentolae]|uniref:histone deacetylase n=1 Tax=Leishmania tarentolae TaxID=5689 RepID=A0A640KAT8_LEITA|nr:histone deacetylase, putative [Leishmania tarentolae]